MRERGGWVSAGMTEEVRAHLSRTLPLSCSVSTPCLKTAQHRLPEGSVGDVSF